MLDLKEVRSIVKSLGRFDDEIIENYRCLIENSAYSVFCQLKKEEYAADKRVLYLAAVKAYYEISLAEVNSDGITSFSAGDIKINRDDDFIASIKATYDSAKEDCADFIKDKCFAFLGV